MRLCMKSEIVKLLKIFVDCPSYIDPINGIDEGDIGKIISFFFKSSFPEYKKITIPLAKNRNNLLFVPQNPKIIFCCHLDTVIPSSIDQMKLKVVGDKAYGLGTKDMKGGWVASIVAAMQVDKINKEKIGFLFYCDEEYEQQGMEVVVKNSNKIPPSVVCLVSPESRFNITYGCRGYAIFDVECFAESTHTSRPNTDHPIEKMYEIYQYLKEVFSNSVKNNHNTLTILSMTAGIKNKDAIIFSDSVTPNYTKATFSLRIADSSITQSFIKKSLEKTVSVLGVSKITINIRMYRSPSNVIKKETLQFFIDSAKTVGFTLEKADPNFSGYNDVAMLSHKLKIPFFGFGPYGEGNHGPNEWVSIESIENVIKVFMATIKSIR